MEKERFLRVTQASILIFDGENEMSVKEIIGDSGAIEIAKYFINFINSYDKKIENELKSLEKEEIEKEELMDINKKYMF